jgi:hypothetical protein
VVTKVEINTVKSTAIPDTCKFDDAVDAAATAKVRKKYQKTENGSCSGDCHCVHDVDSEGKPKKEEGPATEILLFDTEIKIDECTYKLVGTFTMETYDTPGRCHRNGGTIKISSAKIPDSNITIALDNYDNISQETLAQIGGILKKAGKREG